MFVGVNYRGVGECQLVSNMGNFLELIIKLRIELKEYAVEARIGSDFLT